MPRVARRKSSTGIYHVILRGINHQTIFEDDEDYLRLLHTLEKYREKSGFTLYAYCLMGNHIHLLMKEAAEDLGVIFKRIGASYVYQYNRKYRRRGPLFQGRFRSEVVEDDRYFLTVVRYIHQNPLRAGMVKEIANYPWSSYWEYVGQPGEPVAGGPGGPGEPVAGGLGEKPEADPSAMPAGGLGERSAADPSAKPAGGLGERSAADPSAKPAGGLAEEPGTPPTASSVEVPKICDTDYVLNLFSPDREKALRLFREFNLEENRDECLDFDWGVRLNDAEGSDFIKDIAGVKSPTEIQGFDKNRRNEVIKACKVKGLSIRQIERLTGVSFGVVRGV